MSEIGVTEHKECIYNVYEPVVVSPRSPRYISKAVLDLQKKDKLKPKLCLTMGRPDTALKTTTQYLRKGGGVLPPRKVVDRTPHPCTPLAPVVRVAQPLPPHLKRNYRMENILNMKGAQPRTPRPARVAYTKYGDLKQLAGSGEVPEYCFRKDYAKLPAYLVRRRCVWRRRTARAQQKRDAMVDACKMVTPEERAALIAGLKSTWHNWMRIFSCQPDTCDSIPKIVRKTRIEALLAQLERDIAMIEENPYIYVYDDKAVAAKCLAKM